MIDMTKKYRMRNGRKFEVAAIRNDVDPDNAVIGWGECATGEMIACARRIDGKYPQGMAPNYDNPSQFDLIEVVPDVVWWRRQFLGDDHDSWAQKFASLADLKRREVSRDGTVLAILKFTIRNGGKTHTDVTVDVLPVDYVEPTP